MGEQLDLFAEVTATLPEKPAAVRARKRRLRPVAPTVESLIMDPRQMDLFDGTAEAEPLESADSIEL